jgi:hypothetical protein
MGAPAIPVSIDPQRWPYMSTRVVEDPGAEGSEFVFMTDTQEWIVEDESDAHIILDRYPDSKVVISPT